MTTATTQERQANLTDPARSQSCPECGGPMIPIQGGGGMVCPKC